MNLVFNEYLGFLKDKSVDIEKYNLVEGFYWLDRSIIKCYDVEGKIHKVLRIHIDNELNITVTDYKNETYEIESWEGTIERNKDRLEELESESINLIRSSIEKYEDYSPITLTSTGKDSQVTSYLVDKVTNSRKIFNNTSLDSADTYKFVKTMNDVEIINPKEGFYQWRKRIQFIPTRLSRACCTLLKEKSTMDYLEKDIKYLFFLGMRNEESTSRSGYTDEWKNEKWGNRQWEGVLPIRKWNEEQIWLYTLWKQIDINPKYKKGYSRVGCAIACPNYTKTTWVLDKYWYPSMYKRWHDILNNDFIDNQKWTKLNCTIKEYHLCWNGGLLRSEPTLEVINEFAEHKGVNIDIVEKYFNHKCKICDKKVNKNDDIAMNLKLLGRNMDDYFCKKHLMEYLEIDKEQWNTYINEFKLSGCALF